MELRLDTVDRPDVPGALAGRQGPVIVTCRPTWEGGHFQGSEEERLGILEAALDAGAEYVDVEFKALTPAFAGGAPPEPPARVACTISRACRATWTPRVDAMSRTGAGIVKVAVMAHRLADCVPLIGLAARRGGPTSVMAMGEAGLSSRVLAARFGSCWTYAADDTIVAPGQLSAARMRGEFGFDRLGPDTALYGIIGQPVSHSVSPAMHNAAFRQTGIDAVYLPLPAADIDDFISFATAMQLRRRQRHRAVQARRVRPGRSRGR